MNIIGGVTRNKENDYTYSFSAMQSIGALAKIKAVAIEVHKKSSALATRSAVNLPREVKMNASIFFDREEAINWLHVELASASAG